MAIGARLPFLALLLLGLLFTAPVTVAHGGDSFPPPIPGLTPLPTAVPMQTSPQGYEPLSLPVTSYRGANDASPGLDWLTDTPSLVPRAWGGSAVYDGRYIIIIGGRGADPVVYSPAVEIFDTVTSAWRLGSDLPAVSFGYLPPGSQPGPPSIGVAAAVWGDWLHAIGGDYAAGGTIGTWYHCKYHIPTDTWQEFDCPFRRVFGAAVAWNGWIVYLGGISTTSSPPVRDMFAYNTELGTWFSAAPMLAARYGPAAATLGDHIYVAGGKPDLSTFERWDPHSNTWTALMPMPHGRYLSLLIAAEGYLYAVGGRDFGGVVSEVDRYDPHTNTWEWLGHMRTARQGMAGGYANGRLYSIEGAHGQPPVIYDHHTNEYAQLVVPTSTCTSTPSPTPTCTLTETPTPTPAHTPTATVTSTPTRMWVYLPVITKGG